MNGNHVRKAYYPEHYSFNQFFPQKNNHDGVKFIIKKTEIFISKYEKQ